MRKPTIAPSVLNANFLKLGSQLDAVENGGAGLVHLDIMDGNFVPNISFGPGVASNIRKGTSLPLDVHLMVEHPQDYVAPFADAGAEIITIQVESTRHLDRVLNQIREAGCRPSVTLNPATSLESIRQVLHLVDMVLVMSVNPGFGGQALIPYCLDKVRDLRAWKPNLDIQVDGGIKADNILQVKEAGANVFVVGSAIFGTPDPQATTRKLVDLIGG